MIAQWLISLDILEISAIEDIGKIKSITFLFEDILVKLTFGHVEFIVAVQILDYFELIPGRNQQIVLVDH